MLKFLELNDDKQPVSSFDTTYNDKTHLRNAGLLLNNKVVVVDFDNDNANEVKITDWFKSHYPTLTVKTSRGYHFYYSKPDNLTVKNGADKITIGGIQCDYKTGNKSYAIVKHLGVDREVNRELSLKDLPELPIELYPLAKAKNLSGLCDGDGRNNGLFYHLRLIREQYKSLKIGDVAKFINDVVLGESLNDKELQALIDSVNAVEINANGSYNGDPKDMIEFSKFIADELDVKLYKECLYFRDGHNYSKDKTKLNRAINRYLELKKAQMVELEAQLRIHSDYVDTNSPFNIKLRNGVIVDDQVINVDNGFTPFYIDVAYIPEAYDKEVDDFMEFITCGRKDLRGYLEELLGHILLVDRFPHKLFFLTGNGANGKSTFVEMVNAWLGELAGHVDISNFDDGASVCSLIGKLVNIADDVDALYLEHSKNIKTMSSGNTIEARPLYSAPVTIKNTASLVFTANEVPTFKDKTNGIARRVSIIPFDNTVKARRGDMDAVLSTDNAKSYLLNLALAGISRILANGYEMSYSQSIDEATTQYELDSDSVLSYLKEYPDIDNNPVGTVYEAYSEYCDEANLKPISLNKFSRKLKTLGYDTQATCVMGKRVRLIRKITE